MKRYRLIIFLLLLGANIKTFACYNYEDDYWDGGQLPGVDIYPDHGNDNNDDDNNEWWNYYNDDDDNDWYIGWNWGDDDSNDPGTGNSYGNTIQGGYKCDSYTIKKSDKISKGVINLPPAGFSQGKMGICLFSSLSFAALVLSNAHVNEGSFVIPMLKYFSNPQDILNGNFSASTEDELVSALNEAIVDASSENGLHADPYIIDIETALDWGLIVVTDIYVESESFSHSVTIIGYNDDGYIAYNTDVRYRCYTIITSEQIKGTYCVGLRKKNKLD